jgi:hypothetical protein
MTEVPRAPEICGKTMRWTWTTGPTKGATHEHVFHENGTVEWRAIESATRRTPAKSAAKRKPAAKRTREAKPEYAAMRLGPGLYLVSYLASSGYTLTVALDFGTREIQGVASGARAWHPVRGTFETVDSPIQRGHP